MIVVKKGDREGRKKISLDEINEKLNKNPQTSK